MSYTKFGEYFRVLRVKNHEVLADAKKFLGVSSAFISSVECGNKPIPNDWCGKIIMHYGLGEEEQKELFESIEQSKKMVKIDISSASQLKKSVAIQFQRSFEDADEESIKAIQKILDEMNK